MGRALPLLLVVAAVGCGVANWSDDPLANWPAWRGPLANGVAPRGDPPVDWSESHNVRWKIRLPGAGHSTPVVWGDRIYVLAASRTGRKVRAGASPLPRDASHLAQPTRIYEFRVLALDRGTGETIWQTVVHEALPHEAGHLLGSRASASPVTDGEHVWAFFGSFGLYCVDRDGGVVWERDLGDMHTLNEFGEGSSPVLHEETLVVNWDHEGDSFVVALDKRTGEERWRAERDGPTSWSTPLIVEDAGRPLVIVSGSHRVQAYDLQTGEEVWQCGGLGDSTIPAPVADAERIFVMSGHRDKAGLAIRYPGAAGDITDTDAVAWSVRRGVSYVPSPLLYEGKLYFLQRYTAKLSCYDFASGEAHYSGQRLEDYGGVFASPVGAAGRVYVVANSGKTAVLRNAETFELLAENTLDDVFYASPAIAGDEIYLRGRDFLYCLAQP